MTFNLKLATYNTGTNSDYTMIHNSNQRTSQMGKTAFEALSNQNIDVFCMQEAFTYDSGDVFHKSDSWLSNDHDYIHNTKGIALVWNKNKMTYVSGSVIRNQNYLVADFYNQQSQKIVRIASLHIPGYSLESYQNQKVEKDNTSEQAKLVDEFLTNLKIGNKVDHTIIGSDTNSIPTIYDGFHKQFTNSGYSYDTTDTEPTNFHEIPGSDLKERQLDFIFKSGNLSSERISEPEELTLKNDTNPSDHIPVIQKLTAKETGFFVKILQFFLNLFRTQPTVAIETFDQSKQLTDNRTVYHISEEANLS